jgi:FtsH-binding integral membrane protein
MAGAVVIRTAIGSPAVERGVMTTLELDRRPAFLARTYGHFLGAVIAFVLFEAALFRSGLAQPIAAAFLSVNWLWILGGFILTAWLFRGLAYSLESPLAQYLGLVGYVVAEGLIFVPLLYVADRRLPGVIETAAAATLLGFGSLSAVVFLTRQDFSFLEPFLRWAGLMALVLIVCACLFGLSLGLWFTLAMIVLAGASILHDTSSVLLHMPDGCHAAGALELFASAALMFWYVIDLLGSESWGLEWWDF